MFEFIIVLSIIIAAVIVFLSYIADIFQKLKFRNHLLLVCGILYVLIMLVLNPDQATQHDLYNLKTISQLALFPLFVIVPFLYIEQWTGTVFSKFSIFFGAAVLVNYYYAFLIYGNYYFDQFWQVDGLVWTAGILVPAFLVFFGIYFGNQFLSQKPEDKPIQSVSQKSSFISGQMRKVIVVIVGLLVFCIPSLLIGLIGNTQSCGGFEMYTVDPPQSSNGTVIHLTENDFRKFPKMAPIIRDAQYTTGTCLNSMYHSYPCVGKGWIPCNLGSQFGKYQDKYLEYEGRFYFMERSYYT
jgi:hypothetical protein